MKRYISFILIILCVVICSGCGAVDNSDTNDFIDHSELDEDTNTVVAPDLSDYSIETLSTYTNIESIGLTMSLINVTPKGCGIKFVQFGGDVQGQLQTDSAYDIQVLGESGQWEDVLFKESEYAVSLDDMAYLLNMDAETVYHVDWGFMYGELPDGCYRLHKKVYDYSDPSGTGIYDLYAEFVLPYIPASTVIPIEVPSDVIIEGVSISSAEGHITCLCDFNEDGIRETVYVDYSDILLHGIAVPGTIELSDGNGAVIWSDSFGLAYAGYTSFYIAEVEGKPCLIKYFPLTPRQGSWECMYAVYSMDTDNSLKVIDEMYCDGTEEEANACAEKAEYYLTDSILLISTYDSNLKVYR